MAEPTLLPERLQYRPTKIELDESIEKAKATLLKKIKRSVYVYRVDCGGCNGCEIEIFATLSGIIIGFLRSKNSPAALLGSFTVSLLRTAKFSSTHPNLLYILSIIAYSQTIRREFCSRKKAKLRPLSKHGTFFR